MYKRQMQALAIQIVSTILSIIYTIVASSAAVGVGFAGGFVGMTAAVGVLGVFTLIYGVLAIILLVFDIIAMVKACLLYTSITAFRGAVLRN